MLTGNGKGRFLNSTEMILVKKDGKKYVLTILDNKIGILTPESGLNYDKLVSKLGPDDRKKVKEFTFTNFKNYAEKHPILGLIGDWDRFFLVKRPTIDST